jgi:predicted ester cyclase
VSIEKNKAIMRRYVEEAWNKKNAAIADELMADTIIYVDGKEIGREDWKRTARAYYTILGDMYSTIDDMIAEGDKVLLCYTTRAKHIGDWNIPPFGVIHATGKPLVIKEFTVYRLVGGQIVQMWRQADFLGVLQQLGVIKPSA